MQRKYFKGLADVCMHAHSIAFDRKERGKSCRILSLCNYFGNSQVGDGPSARMAYQTQVFNIQFRH